MNRLCLSGFLHSSLTRRLVGSVLAVALGLSTVQAASEIEWEPDIYPMSNFFPSLAIGTARLDNSEELFATWGEGHIGDDQGVVGATVSGLKKGDQVKLVIKANEYMKESRAEGKVAAADEEVLIHPKMSYHYDKLLEVNQVSPLDITMELFVNGVSLGEKNATVTLRSINDCLFGVQESDEENSDYSWLFAAYVNENHPWVDKLLKEALQTGIVSAFDGYQAESADDVLQQIFSIWYVMQRHGIKYSDITTTAAESDGVYSQHVRLFDQSVDAAQANCVDGTVLLAALLRKIGLRPSLVLVPGHMYLAVDLDDESMIGIETTLMGEQSDQTVDRKKLPVFDKLPEKAQLAAWNSFEGAVAVGTDRLKEDSKKLESADLEYQMIDLAAARKMGILPIRFGGK